MRLVIADIEVEVVRKNIKNMHLRVLPPDGRVTVSAPLAVSDKTISGFVASKLSWIRKQQLVLREQPRQTQREGVSGETLYVWGKQCFVRVIEGVRYGMEIQGTEAIFTVRAGSSANQRVAWLREWQRGQLCDALEKVLPAWEQRTGLYPDEWKTKYMKTRWGTCNSKARRVWFNVQLAKYPPECLDYVVLHELAHLKEPTHNEDFKAILDTYMPTWRSVRKKLNEQTLDCIE